MGKIDKEKLLKEIRSLGYYEETQVIRTIKNFPEEPEIDFDALYYEWSEKPMDWSESRSPYDQARSFRDFLKSKNLTVPKPVEIPMDRTWTLKKHVGEIFHDFGNSPYPFTSDPPENLKKYYDKHEELDYSKIPKGSIVVVSTKDGKIKSAEDVDHFDSNKIYCKGGVSYELKYVKILIAELAKDMA